MPKGVLKLADVVSLEDAPGGKKNHFVIHLADKQLHLKSDDYSLKEKWLSTLRQLLAQHKRSAQSQPQLPAQTKSSYKADEADLQVRQEILEEQEGSRAQPSHARRRLERPLRRLLQRTESPRQSRPAAPRRHRSARLGLPRQVLPRSQPRPAPRQEESAGVRTQPPPETLRQSFRSSATRALPNRDLEALQPSLACPVCPRLLAAEPLRAAEPLEPQHGFDLLRRRDERSALCEHRAHPERAGDRLQQTGLGTQRRVLLHARVRVLHAREDDDARHLQGAGLRSRGFAQQKVRGLLFERDVPVDPRR